MIKEQQELQRQIFAIQTRINTLPDGKLICARSKNGYKWYQSDGHKKEYISKKERRLAELLAEKKYLNLKLNALKKEFSAINFYLRHHSEDIEKADCLLIEHPGYKELLAPYYKPKAQKLANWMQAPYEHNSKHPEKLIHQTASGNLVRSKSEVLIDLSLYKNKIPFRYECALPFEDTTLYPDFTIRHPKTGEFYYWEHFGMMDDPFYSQNAFSKMKIYTSHSIIPNIQLITTYETKDFPLSLELIEKIISYYFL